MAINSVGRADKWTQLNLSIDNASPYSLGLRIHNILLTDSRGKIFQPLDQGELIMKINQEAHQYSSLAMIPFVGSIIAIQQLITNSRAKEDLNYIINNSLKDLDIPPKISVKGNLYFPVVENNLKRLTVYLKREDRLIKFCIPMDQSKFTEQAVPDATTKAEVAYNKALAQYKAASYKKAIQQFNQFIEEFPSHDLADNAQYWVGESYYALGLFRKAIAAFDRVTTLYPEGNKAPDALLKIGLCYLAVQDKEKAHKVFQQLLTTYPASNAAQLAKIKLREY
jgi:tol-pal system protein YbgF